MNHYTFIVDLLGYVGYLEKSLNFIAKIPIKPKYAPSYVLLSNIYIDVGSFLDVQRVRKLIKDIGPTCFS